MRDRGVPRRTKPKDRCPNCEVRRSICYCAEIPKIKNATQLLLIMHHRETTIRSNTARILDRALERSEIRYRGLLGEPLQISDLVQTDSALLLFPHPEAEVLTPELVGSLAVKPKTLIALDGSWSQAARMVYRIPELSRVRKVKLPPGLPSRYLLRKEPTSEHLSTFEAVTRALGVLEGSLIQDPLEKLFDLMMERKIFKGETLEQLFAQKLKKVSHVQEGNRW